MAMQFRWKWFRAVQRNSVQFREYLIASNYSATERNENLNNMSTLFLKYPMVLLRSELNSFLFPQPPVTLIISNMFSIISCVAWYLVKHFQINKITDFWQKFKHFRASFQIIRDWNKLNLSFKILFFLIS